MSEQPKISDQDLQTLKKNGYTIGTPLNSGSFAQVYRATRHGEQCAVKVLDLTKTSEEYRLKFLPRELYTLKKLKHSYLINIYDIYSIAKTWVVIFMDLAEGGDLLDLLKSEGNWLAEAHARVLFVQFGDAVRYIHGLKFAHRDIKCENVLLNKDRTVAKLTDLGNIEC